MNQSFHSGQSSVKLLGIIDETPVNLTLIHSKISAGFPSPAIDFVEHDIDLNKILIKNKSSTFLGQVIGNSLMKIGIYDGDYIIIDRSLTPVNNDFVVCVIDGDFTTKRIQIHNDCCWLYPENDEYKPIKVTKDNEFTIWGVLTHSIRKLRCTR